MTTGLCARRILLVYGGLWTGGIETLIIRLANYLVRNGRDVAVCYRGGVLATQLDQGVTRLDYSTTAGAVQGCAAWLSNNLAAPTVLISFDPISAALGLAIEAGRPAGAAVTHLSGVYHPRAYHMTGERRDRVWLNRLVARAVGDQHLFYMNIECRDDHGKKWGIDLSRSAIVPLPVEARESAWTPRMEPPLRIISIGRLTGFKQYNLGIAAIARSCRDAGVAVQWDIYGSGPLADEMAREIVRNEVGDAVTMNGILPYADLAETVVRHDLFVGLGTAALEAAMLGVPSIFATDSEQRKSYGYLHQLPFGNVGERQAAPPPYDIGDLIIEFARLGDAGRVRLSEQGHTAAMLYAMPDVVESLFRLADTVPTPPPHWFKRSVAAFYRLMTASWPVEQVRRVRT